MSGLELPRALEVPNKFGSRLGIEYGESTHSASNQVDLEVKHVLCARFVGFMSTTTNKDVAIHYGQDTRSGKDLSYVLEFALDSLNRGIVRMAMFVSVPLQSCRLLM